MSSLRIWCLSAMLALTLAAGAHAAAEPAEPAQRNPIAELAWQVGPTELPLGKHALLKVPAEHAALNEAESSKFLELTGNLPADGLNIVAGGNWWATFEFDESGYVKDDEKIDADALLEQMKDSDGPANEERRKRGLTEIYTDGWHIPPHYDATTKQLEWALRLRVPNESQPVINYTVRLLGRSGYERAVLVSSPETLNADVAEFKAMLKNFEFRSGQKYSEFQPGDRVAEFGLGALVVGGAAAAAVKSGFWKVIVGFLAASWKLVAGAVVAVLFGIGKLFGRKANQ